MIFILLLTSLFWFAENSVYACESTFQWYALNDTSGVHSPALLVFPERVERNITHAIEVAGDAERLRPHVKTYKNAEVVQMHLRQGVRKFKAATLSEVSMVAQAGAEAVMLAHQPAGPNIESLVSLAQKYPKVALSTLVDNPETLAALSAAASQAGVVIGLWIDINNGMDRSGLEAGPAAVALYQSMQSMPGVRADGIHVYDGHILDSPLAQRQQSVDTSFAAVTTILETLKAKGFDDITVVAGGSPTFPNHAKRPDVELGPGTYPYWDAGYGQNFPDIGFQPAAVLMTRVISKPGSNLVTLDLGSKSVATEYPLDKRVEFLGRDIVRFVRQSEEHLVVEVADASAIKVGDVWYGLPYHICPTVALHQEVITVSDRRAVGRWQNVARDRRLR